MSSKTSAKEKLLKSMQVTKAGTKTSSTAAPAKAQKPKPIAKKKASKKPAAKKVVAKPAATKKPTSTKSAPAKAPVVSKKPAKKSGFSSKLRVWPD